MRIDDEAGEIGQGGQGGAGIDADRGHHDLTGNDRHGENGAVGRCGDAGLGDAVVDRFQAALRALLRVLGEAMVGIEVFVDFLADQLGREELARPVEVAGQFFHRDDGAVDFHLGRGALDLEVAVIDDEKKLPLFDLAPGLGQDIAQFAPDLRFDFHLEGRGNIAAEADLLPDIAPLGLGRGDVRRRGCALLTATGQREQAGRSEAAQDHRGGEQHHKEERP